jgi:hypothetical protein
MENLHFTYIIPYENGRFNTRHLAKYCGTCDVTIVLSENDWAKFHIHARDNRYRDFVHHPRCHYTWYITS